MTASLIRVLVLIVLCAPAWAAPPPAILVMGDSLSAAYGIPVEKGWVQLLQARLREQGYPHRVVNGSITGETTAGGLARLPAALKQHRPAIVLIELGGNDGLRGLPVKQMRANLSRMAELARAAGARPVLFEMRIPANYGAAYTEAFQQAFAAVAREHGAPLVPFFLMALVDRDGVPPAGGPAMFQDDGIHPTAAAQGPMLEAAWPTLKNLLDLESGKTSAP